MRGAGAQRSELWWAFGVGTPVMVVCLGAPFLLLFFTGDRAEVIRDLQRLEVPDFETVPLEPGDYTVYVEVPDGHPAPTSAAASDVVVSVDGPGGQPVPLADGDPGDPYHHADREGHAVRSFRVEAPGLHTIAADGDPDGDLVVAVGPELPASRRWLGVPMTILLIGLPLIGSTLVMRAWMARNAARTRAHVASIPSGWPPPPPPVGG